MSRFRSTFIIAIVSLLVFAGYGFNLFGECCDHQEQAQVEIGMALPDKTTPTDGDDCLCNCHQIASPISVEPLRVTDAAFVVGNLVVHPDEFPPDAVPLGIEYPPQLA